jgi:hypothetical protein
MDLDQIARPGLAVQAVDVLGDQHEFATLALTEALKRDQGSVGRIWLRADGLLEARKVPSPRTNRILAEVAECAQLGDVLLPDGSRILTTKGGNPTGQADARARNNQDPP